MEEAAPLMDVEITVRLGTALTTVTRQPAGSPVAFNYARVRLSRNEGHDILVFE